VAEVFVEFAEPVVAKDGATYRARACGGEIDNGMWQGWLEFLPIESGEAVRSGRETTQPNRQDTEYWATGLTPIYLEGALDRAQNPPIKIPPDVAAAPPAGDSVLNPFSVYRNGESMLRNQLSALSAWHLVNTIVAYDLSEQDPANLVVTPAPVLVELIVASVRERAAEAKSVR
jgi:hypothetical protein